MDNDQTAKTTSKTTTEQMTPVDYISEVISEHPFVTAGVIYALGAIGLYAIKKHATYTATYKANVDAYEYILHTRS